MKNTWIELDLRILRDNLRCLGDALSAGTEIIFVVKSNAYGHGMVPVAKCAWECGVKWFAVVHVDEALTLREILPEAEIIIVGVIDPADAPVAVERNLLPIIVSEKHALSLLSSPPLRCHAKVDTGMGRLGFAWEEAANVLQRLARRPGLDIRGICTHFASAGRRDRSFADVQAERFRKVVQACEENGVPMPFKHMSNSGAILRDAAWDMDGVRPGILLYGYGMKRGTGGRHGPSPGAASEASCGLRTMPATCAATSKSSLDGMRDIETRPFLQWKTRVVQVKKVPAGFPVSYGNTYVTDRETHIATIDVGYADGYSRLLSNRGFVIIGGLRRAVIGRVTMNLVTVDLGPVTDVKDGDEVTLLGSQGRESVWADEIAQWCGTISHEVLTGIRTDDRRICSAR